MQQLGFSNATWPTDQNTCFGRRAVKGFDQRSQATPCDDYCTDIERLPWANTTL